MYVRDYSWAAGGFYPVKSSEVDRMISHFTEGSVPGLEEVDKLVGAVAPHAGWVYSGPTAGKVFGALRDYSKPKLAVCFGAVHIMGVHRATILAKGEWRTPLGNIPIDKSAAEEIMDVLGDQVEESTGSHEEEHSLEVIMPFLKKCFPDIEAVPIMVPPDLKASSIGTLIGAKLADREDVIIVGSSDMTHYGPRFGFTPAGTGSEAVKWVKEVNDRGLIDIVLEMRAEDVVKEASQNKSACGAGAIAATTSACKEMGAKKGYLVEYTTSYDVRPTDGAETFVGYAGIVFG